MKSSDEMPVPASGAAVPVRRADRAPRRVPRARRQYPWAELLRRVFALDALECLWLPARPQHSRAACPPSSQPEQATC